MAKAAARASSTVCTIGTTMPIAPSSRSRLVVLAPPSTPPWAEPAKSPQELRPDLFQTVDHFDDRTDSDRSVEPRRGEQVNTVAT